MGDLSDFQRDKIVDAWIVDTRIVGATVTETTQLLGISSVSYAVMILETVRF